MSIQKRLKEIKTNGTSVGQHTLWYKGRQRTFNVYEVDLSLLNFNHLNGRILSLSKEYERENAMSLGDLAVIDRDNIIRDWIWTKNKAKNEQTYQDLKIKGQLESGVVTKDGLIVDGNRRFMLLSRLQKKEGLAKKFKTVILDETYTSSGITDVDLDIKRLETSIQMGMDEKVDYDPIEKYLKVKDLMSHPKSKIATKEIAEMMNFRKKNGDPDQEKVIELDNIAKLMDRYLKFFKMPDMYSTISEQEDLFINLNKTYNLYKKGKGNLQWTPSNDEVEEYLQVSFYTIRYIYNKQSSYDSTPVKAVRGLLFQNSKKGILADKAVWEDYKSDIKMNDLHTVISSKTQKKEVNKLVESGVKLGEAYRNINETWATLVGNDRFKKGVNRAKSNLSAIHGDIRPKEIIEEAFRKMVQFIDVDKYKASNIIEFNNKIKKIDSSDIETKKYIDMIRRISEKIKKNLKN